MMDSFFADETQILSSTMCMPPAKRTKISEMGNSYYSWICTLDNFSKLPDDVGQSTFTTPIIFGNYEFKLQIYPGGSRQENKNYVSIFIVLCKPSRAVIRFSLSICLQSHENLFMEGPCTFAFDSDERTNSRHGWPQFVRQYSLIRIMQQFEDDRLLLRVTVHDPVHDPNVDCKPHQISKLRSYERFINDEQYSDVKIIIGKRTIHAHKIVLINGNEVFASMFEHGSLRESTENEIVIEDVEYPVMLELIRFIYIGEVHELPKMAEKLLVAADKYGVEPLKDECCEYLCQNLTKDNVLQLFSFADMYNIKKLKQNAGIYFRIHRKEMISASQFKNSLEKLGMDLIIELMSVLSDY